MSNCVNILTPLIKFAPSELDVESMRAALELHKGHEGRFKCQFCPKKFNFADKVQMNTAWTCDTAYWFITDQNSRIMPDGSFELELGKGRSLHTQRDLKETLLFIGQFLNVSKRITLICTDECDNHRSRFQMNGFLIPHSEEFWWDGEREASARMKKELAKGYTLTIVEKGKPERKIVVPPAEEQSK